MSEAVEQRLIRRTQDLQTFAKEHSASRSLHDIRERCNRTFDNIESDRDRRGILTLSELSAKIFMINDCLNEIINTNKAFEEARNDSLTALRDTVLEDDKINIFRSYQDPLPGYQKCRDRIEPLIKSLFVRMNVLKFKVDISLGYTLGDKIELDGTLRVLCGSCNITINGVDDNAWGGRFVRLHMLEMPQADADGKKLSLVFQLCMEVSTHYFAKMLEVRCSFVRNNDHVFEAYKFEKITLHSSINQNVWKRDFNQHPPDEQIFKDPQVAAVFKDFSLTFKKS